MSAAGERRYTKAELQQAVDKAVRRASSECAVTQPSFIHSEPSAFERNIQRLRSLRSLLWLIESAQRDPQGALAEHVVGEALFGLAMMTEDIHRDMYAMRLESKQLRDGAP